MTHQESISLYHLAYSNIYKIVSQPNQNLHRRDFVDLHQNYYFNKERIIDFLSDNDLIETEADPDVFYLAPETYDLLEEGQLGSRLRALLPQALDEQHDEEFEVVNDEDIELTEEQILAFKKMNRKNQFLKITFYSAFGLLVAYLLYQRESRPKQKIEIHPDDLKDLQDIIVIKDGDTTVFQTE
ncbi:hypothetical protein K6119_09515 [Paracrocinitomix mangrovi]|uniref:hypothetical protein n=1 Tax=Paracrocinitomix mangrovi TaxID=2862509 RepID=UPI001C8DE01E|nr:hypothetical protein [Paracrocinitomix mangrovi]UKN03728.1 hypothetical protein K6119_09515 [Paracrocinitomix mangrovi]